MLVSYKWLSQYVDLNGISPDELADKLSRTGLEVEGIDTPQEGLKKIVVGDVKECVPHPNSDHLSICQIDVGEEELYQIVCGAPNIKAGKKVIVAMPNSRITGNQKIKKGKMRGEVSLGMVCSLEELGYSENVIPKAYADGIYFLPEEAIPGEPVFSYLDMDDAIIDISITPNRADALSIRGVAHEVAAIYRKDVCFGERKLVEDKEDNITSHLDVTVLNPEEVTNYRMRMVKDVKVKESPQWLQNILMNEGIRPVNNIVDVTNYVLLLFGQPLHAFDYAKMGSQKVVVRRGAEGEQLVTLDGVERTLTSDHIVITNGEQPLALAGIMGGLDSEITETTQTVVIEAATFDPAITRLAAKDFALRSESSSRFEKGVNLQTVGEALSFAASLMAELGEGTVLAGEVVATEDVGKDEVVTITQDKINRVLGTNLTKEEIHEIFLALGFEVALAGETYTVTIPPRRWDIQIEADLIEEVARVYGYDRLPSTLPKGTNVSGGLSNQQQFERNIRQVLEGSGLTEAISYALTTEEKALHFVKNAAPLVSLQSPMSEDHRVLRQNLITSLLTDIQYNVARKNTDLAFYEMGNIFISQGESDLPKQMKHVALAMTGLWQQNSWQVSKTAVDFYLLKGILENLMISIGLDKQVIFQPTQAYPELHPGRSAELLVEGEVIGVIGQVHPLTGKAYDIPETYVAELDLEGLFNKNRQGIEFQAVSKFPAMKRDIALLVSSEVTNQQLLEVIQKQGGKFLQQVELFDVFQGEKLGLGKKSMAYSLTFQNQEATLTDEEVNSAMKQVELGLIEAFHVEVR